MNGMTWRIVAVCVFLTGAAAQAKQPADAKGGQAAVAKAANDFAVDLYQQLIAKDPEGGNAFISPASVHTALSMTYAGAAGETAEQMAKVLRLAQAQAKLHEGWGALLEELNHPGTFNGVDANTGKTAEVPAYQLSIANALWTQKDWPIKESFTARLGKNYGAGLTPLDFKQEPAARGAINDWVDKQTKGKIKDIIPPGMLGDFTRVVLTNAIYFKSSWSLKFDKAATKDDAFTVNDKTQATVPMMHQFAEFNYFENVGLQALELPYKSDELSMVIVLPVKKDGLAEVEKKLTAENLAIWLSGLESQEVKVAMPKFKLERSYAMSDALAAMGMADAFDTSGKADFSGITAAEPLFISAVLHKTFIAVDEEYTEAAAATAIETRALAMPVHRAEPKVFTADHPFLFLIRHNKSGLILFMGKVTNPKG